jgi:hypothetical protein
VQTHRLCRLGWVGFSVGNLSMSHRRTLPPVGVRQLVRLLKDAKKRTTLLPAPKVLLGDGIIWSESVSYCEIERKTSKVGNVQGWGDRESASDTSETVLDLVPAFARVPTNNVRVSWDHIRPGG